MMAGAARVTRPVAMSMYPTPRELLEIWARDLGRSKPFVEDASQALVLSGVSSDLSRMSAMLRPIAVPMIASGFDAAVFDSISPTLSARVCAMSSPQSARRRHIRRQHAYPSAR